MTPALAFGSMRQEPTLAPPTLGIITRLALSSVTLFNN